MGWVILTRFYYNKKSSNRRTFKESFWPIRARSENFEIIFLSISKEWNNFLIFFLSILLLTIIKAICFFNIHIITCSESLQLNHELFFWSFYNSSLFVCSQYSSQKYYFECTYWSLFWRSSLVYATYTWQQNVKKKGLRWKKTLKTSTNINIYEYIFLTLILWY